MEEDDLYASDPQIVSRANEILLLEDIDDIKKQISTISMTNYLKVLAVLGYNAYIQKRYDIAKEVFSKFKYTDIHIGKNNLAYMIRRKEIIEDINPEREIVYLLRQGIEAKDPFSIMNMALFWALYIGGEKNWCFADELMDYIDTTKIVQVEKWWESIGRAGDIEGYVVHFWLLRHHKISSSALGTGRDLVNILRKQFPQVPIQLFQEKIETIFD